MADRPKGFRRLATAAIVVVALVLSAAVYVWRDDILRTQLDPKEPFQIYDPPPAPDYAQRSAWALMPNAPDAPTDEEPPADVFFISPTTFDGGRHWNAPIDDARADRLFREVMAPNYAGPFVRVGRIFAPRYRQASLYTLMTLRDDAKEARRFAYGDVAEAFRYYIAHYNRDRPFVVVGVEQGGTLAARLIAEEVAPHPALRSRIAAAYLMQTIVPSDKPPLPPCIAPKQTGCLAAWASVYEGEPERAQALLDRSLVWNDAGQLVNLGGRTPICFNPLFGAVVDAEAPARLNLGATNATGLEWGARPAFLTRQVGARCDKGILRVTRPKSPSLKPSGSWTDRRRAPGYNVFFADLEADAGARVATLTERRGTPVD
ncbi:hypothetical protein GGQ61_000755 [Phenylobacterium haematophilum]|uniref:DUF3089 domain-containing protein n=1 Tax=Phenylobacterium haematophilum TaxID=98513 RepID=A0A839ZVI5_9CAUL|nr:DUF3089 domain-containing protein [Phenylobacterium haematophilum]MBB3890058.1 hypothetical protein [Phenylobacterium haematophilum]